MGMKEEMSENWVNIKGSALGWRGRGTKNTHSEEAASEAGILRLANQKSSEETASKSRGDYPGQMLQ